MKKSNISHCRYFWKPAVWPILAWFALLLLSACQVTSRNENNFMVAAPEREILSYEARIAEYAETTRKLQSKMSVMAEGMSRMESLETQLSAVQAEKIIVEQQLQAVQLQAKEPDFIVDIKGNKRMVMGSSQTIQISVKFPTVASTEAGDEPSLIRQRITAVSRFVRAELQGANFKVEADGSTKAQIFDLNAAGEASWSFTVTPQRTGTQKLSAYVMQVDGNKNPITRLAVNEFAIEVSVWSIETFLTMLADHTQELVVGIVTFIFGILAEMTRRRMFADKSKNK